MNQPKFRGFSKELNEWVYGFGWYETDYTEEHLNELGQSKQDAVLFTKHGTELCNLDSMGMYAVTVKLGDTTEDLYEGDVVADLLDRDLKTKYQIIWDDYGLFLFAPLYKDADTGAIDYYQLEEMHGDNIFVYSNVFEKHELNILD